MTNKAMVDLLDVYLGIGKVPLNSRLTLLNAALQKLPSLVESHITLGLGVSQTDIPLDQNGAFDLNDLTVDIWEYALGIIELRGSKSIRHHHTVYRKESEEEYIFNEERGRFHHHTKPKYRIFGTQVFCDMFHNYTAIVNVPSGSIVAGVTYYVTGYTSLVYNAQTILKWGSFLGVAGQTDYGTVVGSGYVSTGNRLVDLFYRQQPTATDYSANISISSPSMQKIIVGLACELFNPKQYEFAMEEIKLLNETAPPTDSNNIPTMEGLGTRIEHHHWM